MTRLLLTCLSLLFGCLEENVEVQSPQTGPITLQLHNFNSLGSVLEGSAPQIHYFVQKADGTYAFTMTTDKTQWGTLIDTTEIDWGKSYMYAMMDSKGKISSRFPKTFLQNDGFESVNTEMPKEFKVVDERLIYLKTSNINPDEQIILNLNPASGVSKTFSNYKTPDPFCYDCYTPYSIHVASNGDFLVINRLSSAFLEYSFFSDQGSLFNKKQLALKNADYYYNDYFSAFLAEHNGDFYFLNAADPEQNIWFNLLHNSKFQFDDFVLVSGFVSQVPRPDYDVEIRFGGNHTQKAYRYQAESYSTSLGDYTFAELSDVPFEVWDVTNDRQLNVAYMEVDNNDSVDPGEVIFVTDLDYSTTLKFLLPIASFLLQRSNPFASIFAI